MHGRIRLRFSRVASLLAVALVALAGATEARAVTVTLGASADASLLSDGPAVADGLTYTSSAVLETFKLNRAILRWTLPADLAGKFVVSADLKVYARYIADPPPPNTASMAVYRVTQSWTEAGVTWLTRDGTTAWSSPGDAGDLTGAFATVNVPHMDYQGETPSEALTFHLDLTTLVRSWASGTANNGILLAATDTSVSTVFLREAAGGAALLTITYLPEPSLAGLALAALAVLGVVSRR